MGFGYGQVWRGLSLARGFRVSWLISKKMNVRIQPLLASVHFSSLLRPWRLIFVGSSKLLKEDPRGMGGSVSDFLETLSSSTGRKFVLYLVNLSLHILYILMGAQRILITDVSVSVYQIKVLKSFYELG